MDIAKIRKKLKAAKKKTKKKKETKPKVAQTDAAVSAGVQSAEGKDPAGLKTSEHGAAEEEFTGHAGEVPADEVLEEPEEELLEFLTFKLSGEDYAIPVSDIEEILRGQKITFVPRAEPFMLGVTSIRGSIVPVIDIKERLSLSGDIQYGEKPKTVLLKGPKGPVGVLLPGELDILGFRETEITGSPAYLDDDEARFITGVAVMGERLISLIRTEEMLNFAGTE